MAKRKITVTVDEDVVDQVQRLGAGNLSAVVSAALTEHVDRLARRAALGELLESWDRDLGPVDPSATEAARSAFDELDGTTAARRTA